MAASSKVNNSSFKLTESQETAITTCMKVIPAFKVVTIKGDIGSGKYTVAQEIFRRMNASVVNFDLCEVARETTSTLSNQHVVSYLDSLLVKLTTDVAPPRRNNSKRGRSDEALIDTLSIKSDPNRRGIIYIRNHTYVDVTI